MSYENKPGTGAIFKNIHKTEDKHPDYKGDVMLPDGTMMDIAGWVKKSKAGNSFLSLSVSASQPKTATAKQETKQDDELPF